MKKILVIILCVAAGLLLIAGWSIYDRNKSAREKPVQGNECHWLETKVGAR